MLIYINNETFAKKRISCYLNIDSIFHFLFDYGRKILLRFNSATLELGNIRLETTRKNVSHKSVSYY